MAAPRPSRSPRVTTSAVALLLAVGGAGGGCSGAVAPLQRPSMSFATVQTLNPGVDGKWILEEFPEATSVERGPDGRLRRLAYRVLDPQGKDRRVELHMDDREVLARKDYTGTLVRPTTPDPGAARLTASPR